MGHIAAKLVRDVVEVGEAVHSPPRLLPRGMIKTHFPTAVLASLALLSVGCDDTQLSDATPVTEAFGPQDAFWAALSSHCGKAYAGKLVSQDAADRDFAGADMRMHVRECSDTRIAIPFHVRIDGEWDRSRTWLITRNDAGGLRLKHDHRHKDGEPDAVTMYGGDTADLGSVRSQAFPVDQESIELFEREGLCASVINTWTVEVDAAGTDDGQFAYQLVRPVATSAPNATWPDECPQYGDGRLFRVEFDLSEGVDPPPPAWGWE